MTISERAKLATAVEKLVDCYGWGGLMDGIIYLAMEYYEGENVLLDKVLLSAMALKQCLTERCPDAPGSHNRSEDHA